eukprot:238698-Prorocentrum_minimum.AAC.1
MECYAFELPLVLTGCTSGSEVAAGDLTKVVLAESMRAKLLVSSSEFDFHSRICMNERVKKIPYTFE